ncbi:leucine-rich repeat-containing protein 46-like [Dysidea avara]|uniref:leucine-rich repeat-containing protein 46-like n=1 Tax=Dysidea avara TaxID=196820 RepID=UPI00332CE251
MISFSLICKRNLPYVEETETHDELAARVLKLTHIRLDRESLTAIDNLDCLGPITNLYLQQNLISKLENLETLTNLRFLTISNNKIKKMENLLCLTLLQFLDLSYNQVDQLEEDQVPTGVMILMLAGNPCVNTDGYSQRLMSRLAKLRQLDGETIREDEVKDEALVVNNEPVPLVMEGITLKIQERTQSRLQEMHKIHSEHKSQLEQLHQQYDKPSKKT